MLFLPFLFFLYLFFHDNIINSQLCIIEKAGHNVMIEQPKEVNEAIENFINLERFIDDYIEKNKSNNY